MIEKRQGARQRWHGTANGQRVKAVREAFEGARRDGMKPLLAELKAFVSKFVVG